jgi:alkanesulfonate monooxygenase SsuD/methylene tetrahydromethanopterin reductase-like flavin-dependent oxidoreductase (luciferase family)
MLELAGELGDGAVVNLFPRRALPRMLEHVDAGARRAGAGIAEREIVCRHQVLVTDDAAAARDRFRASFAPYYATPVYNRFLAWAGFPEVARVIAAGWAARDRARTSGALADELVDEIAIIGTRGYCQDRIRALAEDGIDTHIIACFSPEPEDQRRTYEAFTAEAFSF